MDADNVILGTTNFNFLGQEVNAGICPISGPLNKGKEKIEETKDAISTKRVLPIGGQASVQVTVE